MVSRRFSPVGKRILFARGGAGNADVDADVDVKMWVASASPVPVSAPDIVARDAGKWVCIRAVTERCVAGPTTKKFILLFLLPASAELGLELESESELESEYEVQRESMLSSPCGGWVSAAFSASTARWEVSTTASKLARNSAGLENRLCSCVSACLEKVCVRTGRKMGV